MADRRRFTAIFSDADQLTCPRCGGTFRRDEMAKDASRRTGRKGWCVACDRAKNRAYYAANRERVLAKAAARRPPAVARSCSECGAGLEPPKRVTCGKRRCLESRFRRLNPEAYAAREAAKVARRREKRRAVWRDANVEGVAGATPEGSQTLRGDAACAGQPEAAAKSLVAA